MSNSEYFYGAESEQFSFFRIPRALMKDARFHGLSTDAKLLYGLMLDRMSLSRRNGWLDEQNRVFIYFTLEEIQEVLVCGHNKATRLLVEPEQYALIERVRQGQGKPTKIYIKNFIVHDNEPDSPPESDIKTSGNPTSTLPVFSPLDYPKGAGIYTDKSYTEFSYINLSINPKGPQPTSAQVVKAQPVSQQAAPCQTTVPPSHSAACGAIAASMSSVKQTTLVGGKTPKPPNRASSEGHTMRARVPFWADGTPPSAVGQGRTIADAIAASRRRRALTVSAWRQLGRQGEHTRKADICRLCDFSWRRV